MPAPSPRYAALKVLDPEGRALADPLVPYSAAADDRCPSSDGHTTAVVLFGCEDCGQAHLIGPDVEPDPDGDGAETLRWVLHHWSTTAAETIQKLLA